jgi:two-component system response regulator YesN
LFRKNSVFISWLLSYILILFVPIIIGAVVYERAEKTVEYQINQSNRIMMEQNQLTLDDGLQDISRLINQVELNSKFRQLMLIHKSDSYKDYYNDVMQAINNFKYSRVLTSYTYDFFIYLKNIDKIFAGSGFNDKEIFFKSKVMNNSNYGEITSSEWIKLLRGDYSGKYMNWRGNKTLEDDSGKGIVFSVTLPLNDLNDPQATLVISLNYKKIQGIIQSIQTVDGGWGAIIDKDNHVLFSTKGFTFLPPELKYENLIHGENNASYITNNGEKLVTAFTDSKVVSWKYISVIPYSIFWEKVKSIRHLTIICTILCIVLGIFISLFLTWKNYIPINKLLSALTNKSNLTKDKGFNEYKFIQGVISRNINENINIRIKLNQQNDVLRAVFLTKLLKRKVEDTDYIANALSSYHLKFESDHFAVVIFYIIDFETLFESYYQDKTSEEKLTLVQFIVINILQEQISQENNGYAVEVDGLIACLINFRNLENGHQVMLRTVQEAHAFISDKFKINVSAAISNIHKSYFGIPEAYREALDTIEYQIAMESGEIFSFHDLMGFGGKYNYSIEMENKLINCIKVGDFKNSRKLLDEIFESNFSSSYLPNSLVKCTMFGLANTMLKAMIEISYICGEEMIDELNIADRLLKCGKVQDMKGEMIDILKKVCDYIEKNKKGKRDQLVDNIVSYIENNYSDVDLSVAMIAEELGLTPAYLTKLFKEQTGEGIFDYISKLRIGKAMIMLKEPKMNVKEVAEKVGYFNSNVFIRAFKKYVGVTPGKYKGRIVATDRICEIEDHFIKNR